MCVCVCVCACVCVCVCVGGLVTRVEISITKATHHLPPPPTHAHTHTHTNTHTHTSEGSTGAYLTPLLPIHAYTQTQLFQKLFITELTTLNKQTPRRLFPRVQHPTYPSATRYPPSVLPPTATTRI